MQRFVKVPMAQGYFTGIDPLARLAFGLLWDRYRLSDTNVTNAGLNESAWYDEAFDDIFFVYDVAKLAADMGCSERTARRCLDDLRRSGIITWKRTRFGGANKYFIPQYIKDSMR